MQTTAALFWVVTQRVERNYTEECSSPIHTVTTCQKGSLTHKTLTSYFCANGSQSTRHAEANRQILKRIYDADYSFSVLRKRNLKILFCPALPNIRKSSAFFLGSLASLFCQFHKWEHEDVDWSRIGPGPPILLRMWTFLLQSWCRGIMRDNRSTSPSVGPCT
jgi:hypothetical protein